MFTGKPVGMGPLGRHRRRYEENIRKDLKEVGINTRRNWVDSADHRYYWRAHLNTALNHRVP